MNSLRVSQLRSNMECYLDSLRNAENRTVLREHYNDLMHMFDEHEVQVLFRYVTERNDEMPKWYVRWMDMMLKLATQRTKTVARFDKSEEIMLNIMMENSEIKLPKMSALICEFLKYEYRYMNSDATLACTRRFRREYKKQISNV